MGTGRWRVHLVEEMETLPVRWQPPPIRASEVRPRPRPEDGSVAALIAAFGLLSRRGAGSNAWAAPIARHPIAFLLDTVSDAIRFWGPGGELVYRNLSAERLPIEPPVETSCEVLESGGARLERRCLRFESGGAEYMLEVIHELRD